MIKFVDFFFVDFYLFSRQPVRFCFISHRSLPNNVKARAHYHVTEVCAVLVTDGDRDY
jgi:hypothetical protein